MVRNVRKPAGSQVERVYAELKREIVDGRYSPGVPLAEGVLSQRHRASRTPIREALTRLAEEGYVHKVQRRGFSVAPVTLKAIQDMFEIRRLVEGAAAARAAEVASAAEARALAALARADYAVRDPASYRRAQDANSAFHLAVAAASHNGMLRDLVQQCLGQMRRFMSLGIDFSVLQETAAREHRAIAAAIRRRQAETARVAMEKHLDACSDLMMSAVVRGQVDAIAM
jgi:DNA-binding GntR family transcriptional regulator